MALQLRQDDPIQHAKFCRTELAIDTIATMLGYNANAQIAEENKPYPDQEQIKALYAEEKILCSEQNEIYSGNAEVQQFCIDKYCPVIRKKRGLV